MDREDFLARVRFGLGRRPAGAAGEPVRHRPPIRRTARPPETGAMLERLARELEEVGGRVHRVASPAAAREKVVEILRRRGAGSVVRGDTALLAALELDAALAAAGLEVTVARLGDGVAAESLRAAAFAADAGVTSVDAAVAETGTLALFARPGQGRSVSLLPPLHVAVLDARDVVWELGALFERIGRAELPSAVTLVTGPSRTGDIELVLTVGVHGPGRLRLVVIDGR